ncbi:glycosyltransferase [Methanosphaera cuniculi]|uniref:glycosyltransferase n=1 Tax=Methanosphaera cuniculi TaxID=1077256 RepID=UPI0026EFFC26|nr:glycosyltransferase [Methanosphaera cuniculi]
MNMLKEEIKDKNTHDIKTLLQNSKFFDPEFYKRLNPNLKNKNLSDDELIEYYIQHNRDELIPPSRFFDIKWYISHNPDVKERQIEPLIHFLKFGRDEKRLYRPTQLNFDILDLPDKTKLCEEYKSIFHSELFDIDYYLNNNGEFSLDGYDPIIHYILIGAKRGYNPSERFNTNHYIGDKSFDEITINPLYHYIKFGKDISDERFNKKYIQQLPHINDHTPLEMRFINDTLNHLNHKVTIIIPIHDAYEQTCRCIQSVLLNTHVNYNMILVNDASCDPQIETLLDKLSEVENITVVTNKENKGFVKSANIAMKIAYGNDVVLLTSDTIVTPRWLSKLIIGAYSKEEIATVTPVSNNSDLSAPRLGLHNDQLFVNKNSYQLEKLDYDSNQIAPIGNGICIYIKNGAIVKLGFLEEAFNEGYGEDIDFTARAFERGWLNLRSFDTFIYHEGEASFNHEKIEQLKEENKNINLKHRKTLQKWDQFKTNKRTKELLDNIKNTQFYANKERILYITQLDHKKNPIITPEYYMMAQKYETHVLTLDDTSVALYIYDGIFKFRKIYEEDLMNADEGTIRSIYFNLLTMIKYNLLYVKQSEYNYAYKYLKITEFIKLSKPLEIPVVYEGDAFYLDLMDQINYKLNPIEPFDETIKKAQNRIDLEDKKIAVYTAVTGGYDILDEPSVENNNFDYICFTDNPNLKSDFWEIRLMDDDEDLDVIRRARKYKILAHKYLDEYDYSVWIDGNFDIITNIADYIKDYSKDHKLLAIPHESRNCIYKEARDCIERNLDSEEIITEQMEKYKQEGYPENNGLIASSILFRDHNDPEVIDLMEAWFDEVRNHSRRDQLSFNYVCWKNNFKYDTSDIFYFRNQYFNRKNHGITQSILNYGGRAKDVLNTIEKPTTVIIPIYNAYEDTRKCIKSVLKYTNTQYELLLIDDASPDKRINPMLREFSEKYDHIHLITNTKNHGFVSNVNLGITSSSNDVVLLNSDTIVTPNWLRKLKISAYLGRNIGTVTPLSNNAGAFSVPIIGKTNIIDEKLGLEATSNIIEKINDPKISTPTAHGFCMYIKRAVIDDIGLFDMGFNMGYCEENDFSMRAFNAGWENVIDPTVYIYHNQGSSFGKKRQKLMDTNRKYLETKHPDYKAKVTEFLESEDYLHVREDIGDALANEKIINEDNNKKNILYVIHESKGGTPYTTNDLMQHISDDYNVYLLTSGKFYIKLYKFQPVKLSTNKGLENGAEFQKDLFRIYKRKIKSTYSIQRPYNEEFEQVYFNILVNLHIDIVHIRHLIYHTFDMPRVAHALGLKVILSFHDLYYICPSHNLIDDRGQYCGGYCTPKIPQRGKTSVCSVMKGINAPEDVRSFLPKWRKSISEMYKYCDEFITTSQSTYDLYTEFYPELKEKPFHIIEHGRDLKTPDIIDITPDKVDTTKPIKIAIPGNINIGKGIFFINKLKEYDIENRLELHFMGDVYGQFRFNKLGIQHGAYKRSDFKKIIDEIDPMFIGIFSIWPETYCHTLTEAWSTGVPPITMDIGALGERVKSNGGGFIISDDPKEAYEQIIKYAENTDEYIQVRKQIEDITFPSTHDMAEKYLKVYTDSEKSNILFTGLTKNSSIISDLIFELADYYNIYALTSDDENIKLYKYNQLQPGFISKSPNHTFSNDFEYVKKWNIKYIEKSENIKQTQLKTIADELVSQFDIKLIQVESMDENINQILTNTIADNENIKIITSINDTRYLNCENSNVTGKTESFTQKLRKEQFIKTQDEIIEVNDESKENNNVIDDDVLNIIRNSSELIFKSEKIYDKYIELCPEFENIKSTIIEDNMEEVDV